MISNFSIESCKKFYVIEKTVEAAVDIAGEPEIIRIEALQSLPDRMYSARSFKQMPVTIQPTYPQTHGKFDHKPQDVRIWVDFDLPSANGQNADDVLNLALSFLRERCSS